MIKGSLKRLALVYSVIVLIMIASLVAISIAHGHESHWPYREAYRYWPHYAEDHSHSTEDFRNAYFEWAPIRGCSNYWIHWGPRSYDYYGTHRVGNVTDVVLQVPHGIERIFFNVSCEFDDGNYSDYGAEREWPIGPPKRIRLQPPRP